MSLVFPSNPSLNQTTTTGGRVWTYNGDGWVAAAAGATSLSSVSGNIIPSQNEQFDLGTSSLRWRDLYLSGNTIDLGGREIRTTANGDIRFSDSASNQLTSIEVAEIALGTGGNIITLQGSPSGLVTISGNNVITSGTTVLERHYNYPGSLVVNTGTLRWYAQSSSRISRIRASVVTASAGAAISLRVNKNGSSAATLSIAASTTASSINTNINLSDGDYITVDIIAIGIAPNTGSDLVVSFLYSRT